MIECSLRCTNKGKADFKDLPVGSVFRTEEGNDYIFLKIEDANALDDTDATLVTMNAVKLSSNNTGTLVSFNPEELVEELYNVELQYDTIP